MSEKEKTLTEQIGKLPPELQERFLAQAQGAAMALDLLDKRKEERKDAEDPD